ncbi:hypothetical protein JT31_21755 [Cedecea neteri]|uniref:Uncharacterized protein n=1 Tax=Cedecea neteri TaxID=158822 RepID=A0A089RL14_9ENTR|nr:hypothetical protein [Cedecea neteri]AIR07140.1 hypothetical protein JT31_21755 [Cedecea neteri]
MTEQTNDERGIACCPKGTRPYEQTRRIGQFYRNLFLKCNCGCLRVEKSFFEGSEAKRIARAAAIQEWNEKAQQLRKEQGK